MSGTKTYNRVNTLDTSPYYRWDNSVLPRTEAFPPDFRMIAYSTDNLFTECCDYSPSGDEICTEQEGTLNFPTRNCDFFSIALGETDFLSFLMNQSCYCF